MSFYMAYITAKDKAEAYTIGKVLVGKKLAACVNILDGMQSLYWWEGKLEESREAVLIAKTTEEKVEALISTVKQLHSYEVPCVVTYRIADGNPDYLKWLGESVS